MSPMTPEEFWSVLHNMPLSPPVFYRLYYSDDGAPIMYSMEDGPGNYIDVDPQTYAIAPFNVRVVDNKLTYIRPKTAIKKLQPAIADGIACDLRDVCVVVDTGQPHTKWTMVNNEIN